MKTNKILSVMVISLLISLTSPMAFADNMAEAINAADKALIPQIEGTFRDKSVWNEYIRRIDETTWSKKKKNKSFMASLVRTFEKTGIKFNVNSTYAAFSEARRDYFEHIHYTIDERESYVVFRQFLTDTQVQEYFRFLGRVFDRGGWRIYERSSSPGTVTLEIVWLTPKGLSQIPDFSATVLGGSVPGAPDGQLFPEGYKLQNGSQSVSVIRDKDSDVIVNLNAAGRSLSYTVESENSIALSSASPVGTIIASMLPPHRYTDVTNDKSNWFAKTAKWVPADGREVSGSKYANLISSRVPDLRGQFLRGLNQFEPSSIRKDGKQDPEGDSRMAGHYQEDQFKSHTHEYTLRNWSNHNRGGSDHHRIENGGSARTTAAGGSETRPKNIAIYYYIRIN